MRILDTLIVALVVSLLTGEPFIHILPVAIFVGVFTWLVEDTLKRKYDENCIFAGHEWDECTYYGKDHSCPCEKLVTVKDGKYVHAMVAEATR